MINVNSIIYEKLKETGVRVSKDYPTVMSDYPSVVYTEINNIPYKKCDGIEVISDIAYQIDIYTLKEIENKDLALSVDGILSSLGLNRGMFSKSNTSSYYRTILRYEGKIDLRNGLVYQ